MRLLCTLLFAGLLALGLLVPAGCAESPRFVSRYPPGFPPTYDGLGECPECPLERADRAGCPGCGGVLGFPRETHGQAAPAGGHGRSGRVRVAERLSGTCTEAVIDLPEIGHGSIVFHGDLGPVTLAVEATLEPGRYYMRYDAQKRAFVITPWPDGGVILRVDPVPGQTDMARYKAYLPGMDVPLRVTAKRARCSECTELAGLSGADAARLVQGASGKDTLPPWAPVMSDLAAARTGADVSADEVRRILNAHRDALGIAKPPARTTREALEGRGPVLAELYEWEKALWRDYVDRYGHTADVTDPEYDDLRITRNVRLSMALRMAPQYMAPGAREAAEALFNDPVFKHVTVISITAYFALWMAPDPIFSKAAAVVATVGMISVVGFTAAEIWSLARAWMRLSDEAGEARTMDELERAAERFGKSLGGSAVRILVALACMFGGKALPARPPGGGLQATAPARVPALASAGGTESSVAAVAGGTESSVAVVAGAARPGWGLQVKGNTLVVIPNALAMAAAREKQAGGSAGGGGGSGPGRWVRVKENMSKRAARYQEQITGRSIDEGYEVNGVHFDGYRDGKLVDVPEALLEAKGQGYKSFVKDGQFADWFVKDGNKLLAQADRQYKAARGIPIEWHVAEAEVIPVLRRLFEINDIHNIKLIHTPYTP